MDSFKINKWEGGPTKMTADILHAGFNIFNSLKKNNATEFGGKNRSKKPRLYKNVPH